ncbi:MAG: signal peptidase I [Pseudonocardiaceae bacterium]|nr:signal peptidase I [Pseudonocardiaceae bacterium]
MPSTDPARGDDRDGLPERSRSQARHRRRKQRKKGSFWRELPILVVTALVLTFLIQTFLARVYLIPSASMEQTLHGCSGCTNDRVLVDKVTYRFSGPVPGDVIVFRGPNSWAGSAEFSSAEPDNVVLRGLQEVASLIGLAPPDERDFVKRVIATGGQTVECCDGQDRVLVDGKPLVEPYVYLEGGQPQEDFAPVTVPEGNLWVMGDNRKNSADSRRHVDDPRNGTIPVDNVIGEARLIVMPPSRWDGIADPNPQQSSVASERR